MLNDPQVTMTKRILLDCDGVLSDFVGGFLRLVNSRLGTSFTGQHVTGWDIAKSIGLDTADAAAVKRAVGAAAGFARSLDVYPGAVDGVRRLQELAEVHIVTSPWNSNPTWCHDREWWLMEHFGIPHSRVTHTSAKHLIAGDILVDDKTSHCTEWCAAWPGKSAVQWQMLHNRRDAWDGQSTCDWGELARIVEALP